MTAAMPRCRVIESNLSAIIPMDSPWFRRSIGFGYIPIKRQGWLVLAATLGVFAPSSFLFVKLGSSHPVASLICDAIAATVGIAGNVVVVWKLERDYSADASPVKGGRRQDRFTPPENRVAWLNRSAGQRPPRI